MSGTNNVFDLLNSGGKSTFIKYYFPIRHLSQGVFTNDEIVRMMTEKYTFGSKNTKVSKLKKIFQLGVQIEALKAVIASDRPEVQPYKRQAQLLLKAEQKGF